MALFHFFLFAVLFFGWFILAITSSDYRKRHNSRNKKLVFYEVACTLLLISCLISNWFLWDTAEFYADLAVVRNGEVVETNRSFVWTYDGTSTFVFQRPVEKREFDFTVSGLAEYPSYVFVVAYPDKHLSDLEMAKRQFALERDFYDVFPGPRQLIITTPEANKEKGESVISERLEEELSNYGWHLAAFVIVKVPTN